MIKNIMKNIETKKAGMPEKLRQGYIDHAKKISTDSLESLIRNKDKAYVDYNDEIAQIYADELKARKPQHLEDEDKITTDITQEDIDRFGKSALSGLSGKRSAPEEKRFYMTKGRERDLLKYLKPDNKNLGLKGDDIQSFTFDEAIKELMSRSPAWTEEKAKKYIQGAMDNPYEDWLQL